PPKPDTSSQGTPGGQTPGNSDGASRKPGDAPPRAQGTTPGAAPGCKPPLGPVRGANPTRGEGPGGAGQDAQGRAGPTGVKGVLLDIAGMTNLEFGGGDPKGVEGGLPGGWGWGKLQGEAWQWLYIGLSLVSFTSLVLGIGEVIAGIRGLFR